MPLDEQKTQLTEAMRSRWYRHGVGTIRMGPRHKLTMTRPGTYTANVETLADHIVELHNEFVGRMEHVEARMRHGDDFEEIQLSNWIVLYHNPPEYEAA